MERVVQSISPSGIQARQITCSIGAELDNVNLGVASRDKGLVNEIRELLLKHKVLFFRNQDITRAEHVAFATAVRRAGGSPGCRQRPRAPGPRAHLQVTGQPQRSLRELLALRRHLARKAALRLRASLRGVPAGGRRHHMGQPGLGLRAAAPEREEPDRHLARPPQHRSELWRQHAHREEAGTESAVPRRRASCRSHASRDGREGVVRQLLHHPLHQLPHGGECSLRPGLHPRWIGPAALLASARPRFPNTRSVGTGSRAMWRCGTTAARSTTP